MFLWNMPHYKQDCSHLFLYFIRHCVGKLLDKGNICRLYIPKGGTNVFTLIWLHQDVHCHQYTIYTVQRSRPVAHFNIRNGIQNYIFPMNFMSWWGPKDLEVLPWFSLFLSKVLGKKNNFSPTWKQTKLSLQNSRSNAAHIVYVPLAYV